MLRRRPICCVRRQHSLCDRALNVAYERNKSVVDAQDVYEATQRMGLITDVFHYIVMLNNQQRKAQELNSTDQPDIADSVPTPVVPKKDSASVTDLTKVKELQKNKQKAAEVREMDSVDLDISANTYEQIANTIKAKYEKKNLIVPVFMLLMSIVALMGSVYFFCHRTSPEGLLACLQNISL